MTLVKLLVLAGLLAWVVGSIQWSDRLSRVSADKKETLEVIEGKIIGPWDAPEVRFRADTDTEERVVSSEPAEDGSTLQVTAGFLTYVRNLDVGLFLAGALCFLFSMVFASQRWWWLLRKNTIEVTRVEALRYTWIGVFFNNVVPGLTGGDLVKAIYITKRAGSGSRVAAIISVVVDRILGLASLALLGAIVVLFYRERFPQVALAIWGVLAAVGLFGVVAFSRRIRRGLGLDALLRRLPMSGHLQRIDNAIFFYRSHSAGIAAWLIAGALNHGVSVLSVLLIGQSIHVGMPPAEYFVLIPVINIVSAVPVAPNGWGVGEWLYGTLFGKFGARHLPGIVDATKVMATRGVALSVLYRIHTTLWSLIGGVLMFVDKDRVTRDDVEDEIAREERGSVG